MCAIQSILRAEEILRWLVTKDWSLVMLMVRFCHNKQVWRPTTAQGLNSPVRDPIVMTHSLLSSLKEIHRDRQYIWSTTKHNTAISKNPSCQMTSPSETGPRHSGTRSLLRVPVFLSIFSFPVLSVMDFWGWSSVYFHLLPWCAAPASGRR